MNQLQNEFFQTCYKFAIFPNTWTNIHPLKILRLQRIQYQSVLGIIDKIMLMDLSFPKRQKKVVNIDNFVVSSRSFKSGVVGQCQMFIVIFRLSYFVALHDNLLFLMIQILHQKTTKLIYYTHLKPKPRNQSPQKKIV